MKALSGMALLSAAVLLLQVTLTRVFSVAQFYHFAFLVVSLALLGFGVSGSLLAIAPRLKHPAWHTRFAAGFACTALLSYLVLNHFAFDSYSIAWDRRQVFILIFNLVALAVPFAFAGALIGALLSADAAAAGQIYAANLIGSAGGALIAPLVIGEVGSERAVVLCVILGFAAAIILARKQRIAVLFAGVGVFVGAVLLIAYPDILQVVPSPYKNLSHFRRNPDATIVATYQNAYSRLDVVESRSIHSVPGLSLTYLGELPEQIGLVVDGSNMLAVSNASQTSDAMLQSVPAAVAYAIRPAANSLVLGSAGGMDALVALANGAQHVTVIEPNQLVHEALTTRLQSWAGLAGNPRVTLLHEELRVFARNAAERYDVAHLALRDNYQPITSGAFSLTEDYTMTVEAFRAYLGLLDEDGLLVVTRWLQEPASESLRTLGIILEALDKADPTQHIVAFRTFQMATFIIKAEPFTASEVDTLLERIDAVRYDLVMAPEMPLSMINQYAVLESPVYHTLFTELATASHRDAFYASYDFEITPPTDDRPFFFHFFRWQQTPDILNNLGQRWQPFGGSGYFVLVALLIFAVVAAFLFILLPIAIRKSFRKALVQSGRVFSFRTIGYFTALGLAFLLVEVGLIQVYMLVLGQPTVAIATVIGAVLLFSGIGSAISNRVPAQVVMIGLVAALLVYRPVVGAVTDSLFGLPIAVRILATALMIAPIGLLMGMPFPQGIRKLVHTPELIPWAWAANGSASVISAVLAVMLALSFGFGGVLVTGSVLYALAGLLAWLNRLRV